MGFRASGFAAQFFSQEIPLSVWLITGPGYLPFVMFLKGVVLEDLEFWLPTYLSLNSVLLVSEKYDLARDSCLDQLTWMVTFRCSRSPSLRFCASRGHVPLPQWRSRATCPTLVWSPMRTQLLWEQDFICLVYCLIPSTENNTGIK